ncbi:FliM/FliN family flagellar motor switch protein [Pedococcus sp. KACC 23699]|uniref:Flagellar motor switch protein FliM n=1 Tax=Pedococcus sp. KACC 23699 TaxID=3149228 RepID=A0AAU7JZ68_9MICO
MSAEPLSYDFRSPGRLSRERVRALQVANETFARQLSTVLSTTLRTVVHARVQSVRQVTYDEYVRTVPNPSLLAVLTFASQPGSALFQLPMGVVMSVIDRLLGGAGGRNQPIRALSEIETSLVRDLVQRVAAELTYAFENLAPVRAGLDTLESNTQFLQIAAPADPVVSTEVEIRIGDQAATATLCMTLTTLKPILASVQQVAVQAPADGPVAVAARTVEQRLQQVEIDVSVAFREVTLTSAEVFSLAVGDVVPLRHPVAEPLVVAADGVPVASATPGSHGKRLAAQIVTS